MLDAEDGAAALPLLNDMLPIDLLVTNVGLPGGMNGRQLADAARVGRPGLEVLFITGYAENAVLNHGHLEPEMHVMTKPLQMESFARKVGDLVGRGRDYSALSLLISSIVGVILTGLFLYASEIISSLFKVS